MISNPCTGCHHNWPICYPYSLPPLPSTQWSTGDEGLVQEYLFQKSFMALELPIILDHMTGWWLRLLMKAKALLFRSSRLYSCANVNTRVAVFMLIFCIKCFSQMSVKIRIEGRVVGGGRNEGDGRKYQGVIKLHPWAWEESCFLQELGRGGYSKINRVC